MGDIVKRGTKDKPRFYIRYVDADGKRRQRAAKGARTVDEARRILSAAELRVSSGKVGIEELTNEQKAQRTITMNALADKFLEQYAPPKIKDLNDYRMQARTLLNVRIRPALGARAAASVTRADVEALRDRLRADGYANSSINHTLRTISTMFTWGARVGHIACANPASGVERLAYHPSLEYLERHQVGTLLATTEADAQLHAMVTVAVYAGLRKGELLGLRWCDVALEAARLDVMRSYKGLPKGGKPRHLPLHPEAVRVMRQWRDQAPKNEEQLVFPIRRAGVWKMGITSDTFGLQEAFKAAKCPEPSDGHHWHMLRHSFASHAVMAGVDIFTVSKLLGHADVKLTTKVYAHLAPDFMAAQVARLNFSAPTAGVADLGEERRRRAAEDGQPADTNGNAKLVGA